MALPIVPPIRRVGVIGGGQLAWMMAPAAQALGLDLVVQTPQPDDPAVAIAAATVLAGVADVAATATLAEQCEVITFENELIDCQGLQPLAQQGVRFCPSLAVLDLVLDKARQRQCFERLGLASPGYAILEAGEDLACLTQRAEAIGFPLVIKSRRLGYDGDGTRLVSGPEQLGPAWASLGRPPVLLEEFVPFKQELAVMVARSRGGQVALYPTVETQQVDQICRRVLVPAQVSAAVQATMARLAYTLAEGLDLVGILGIECFLTQDDRVLINEIAPRTHNSGHYSLDACQTSQFEQQLRAVSDRPLGPTDLTCPQAVMVNLLGLEAATDYPAKRRQLQQLPASHLYWYHKAPRPGRKLGHITLCLGPEQDPAQVAQGIEALWYGSP
ncbi:MAG: 5-(carboxyamino)imidazole ribonucleotide synthase [Cyanobacteriota bacterium]|nr:5-(carboxyamino)imidazole ribonucleotide synthase [Cyanobacteriota bacterium]